jgi:hypothetical protein
VSRLTDTTVHTKTVSSAERAALALAKKMIAAKPTMRPATALRKVGITSAAKIRRLSPVLLKRQAQISDRGGRKSAQSVKRNQRGKTAKIAMSHNASRGPSKSEPISASVIPSMTATRTASRSELQNVRSGSTALMELWAESNVRWWSQLMRWSPFGIMLHVMTQTGKTPATATTDTN